MTYVNVCVTYSIEVSEIDEVYNECDDPDLIDEKIDDILQEIHDDPLYFIERFGYDMSGNVTFKKDDSTQVVMFYE